MTATRVTLEPIPVMYVESDSGPAGAKDAFERLEKAIGSLTGRKFYGVFYPPDGPYRACVAIEEGDDPAGLGLLRWELPGGVYLRRKLRNWAEHLDEIGSTFIRMAEKAKVDRARPSIEFYRSRQELHLLLPVVP